MEWDTLLDESAGESVPQYAVVILNSVTLFQHRLDWSIYERKEVLVILGIANQDLAIAEVNVTPSQTMDLAHVKAS